MGITKLATPVMGMGVEELTDLMFKYYRELEYLLNGNLDGENVSAVHADWVYAGGIVTDQITAGTALITSAMIETITTDQITAGTAVIATALIEALVVGTNVGIGSAPKVFNAQPTTPYRVNDIWIDGTDLKRCTVARASGAYVATDWGLGTTYTNPTGVTSIVGGVITTDYVNALNITAAYIAAEGITSGTISGVTIDVGTDITVGNNIYMGNTSTGDQKFIKFFESLNSYEEALINVSKPNYPTDNYTRLFFGAREITFDSYGVPKWRLENLALDSQFASYYTKTEANARYVKTSQDLYIQYFSDHMEIKSTAGGTYKSITYDP